MTDIDQPTPAELLCMRDFFRESMNPRHSQPEWLEDPSLVPDEALVDEYGLVSHKSYQKVAEWMTGQYVMQTQSNARDMDFNAPIKKRGIEGSDAVRLVEEFYYNSYRAFIPGFMATAEVISAVPIVATRAGIPQRCWVEVAKASVQLGQAISRDGTRVQAVARGYLATEPFDFSCGFDSRCLKIDQTTGGLTTVTPIEDIISTSAKVLDELDASGRGSAVCVALQVAAEQGGKDKRMVFDQVWDSFSEVSAKRIFPHIDTTNIPIQLPPDPTLRENIKLTARISYTRPGSLTPLLKAYDAMIINRYDSKH